MLSEVSDNEISTYWGGGRRDHKYDNVNYRSLTTNWFADKPIQTNYEWRNHSYILSVTVTDVL